jgi:hypothetical protein
MKGRRVSWDVLALLDQARLTEEERRELVEEGHRSLRSES